MVALRLRIGGRPRATGDPEGAQAEGEELARGKMGPLSAGTEPPSCCLERLPRPPVSTCGRSGFCSWGLESFGPGGQPWSGGTVLVWW